MIPILEVRELYDCRYKDLLREPVVAEQAAE
jgi:hypothetical protein